MYAIWVTAGNILRMSILLGRNPRYFGLFWNQKEKGGLNSPPFFILEIRDSLPVIKF